MSSNTIHRRDFTVHDFRLLSHFTRALMTLQGDYGRIPLILGNVPMCLPLWTLTSTGWALSRYKIFLQEGFGVETRQFRRVCRYIRVDEPLMITTLFRFSILGIVPQESIRDQPRFRMALRGQPMAPEPQREDFVRFEGFLLERRRAEGLFRSPEKASVCRDMVENKTEHGHT